MVHSVRRHLRVAIQEYDASIRRFIPGYEDMIREAASAVADVSPALVLDLGAGTGALSEALLSSPEVGVVELVDVDVEMLRQALRSGGVFVNADVTMPAEEPERGAALRGWATHLVASGIEERRAWEHFAEWADEDTYFPLEEELAALEAAGFAARCAWREGVSTVVVARHPLESAPPKLSGPR